MSKSFLQSSAQNFEPYKPDNAILRYQNQHARQLGLDFPSFTSQKDKNNNSDQSERHKLSSSDKREHRTDRSDKNVIESTFPISKRNISIINYNLVGHSTTKVRGQDSQWAPWWAPWWDLMGPLVGLNGPPGGHQWAPWYRMGPLVGPLVQHGLPGTPVAQFSPYGVVLANNVAAPLARQETHTQMNHRHNECHYKDGEQTASRKHPNLGKAPSKTKDYKSKGDK